MSLESADKEAAAVAVPGAPRVSLADIEKAIAAEFAFTADQAAVAICPNKLPPPSLALLSICILVLYNGFTIIGKSAPASAANFNADLGKKLAREDAVRQCWPLMGFALRDRLTGEQAAGGALS
jgi:hypothetical protein